MKIIEPKVELWQQGGDAKAHVARCARVCYGREIEFYGFNNRFRTTKNTEAIVFEKGGFVGNLGLSKKTMEEIY